MQGRPSPLIRQAREHYAECLVGGLRPLVDAVEASLAQLIEKPAERQLSQSRREVYDEFRRTSLRWIGLLTELLHRRSGEPEVQFSSRPMPLELTLVDDEAVERRIVTSRLSNAMADEASWELADLRSRLAHLGLVEDADVRDIFQTQTLARLVFNAWDDVRLSLLAWQTLEAAMHAEFSLLVRSAVHDTNRWFITRNVLPQVDLRPFIRRALDAAAPPRTVSPATQFSPPTAFAARANAPTMPAASDFASPALAAGDDAELRAALALRQIQQGASAWANSQTLDETRLQTRAHGRPTNLAAVDPGMVDWIERQVPGFNQPARAVSEPLEAAMRMAAAQPTLPAGELGTLDPDVSRMTPAIALDHLRARTRELKDAASTPVERATVELVALMFQALLSDERLPAVLRVWFARLQMPVLRLALAEPEFFASTDHPARKLIDRMGACVMGFNGAPGMVGDVLESELRRIVQVIEAFPDSGRRVFQTVLNEFEQFLERYFATEHANSQHGVSLAQQVEQRETLAIQTTIELRKMIEHVPVHDGIRQFLYQIWADVIATSAVRDGMQAPQTRDMQGAAGELVWAGTAKATREERSEVIRRIPALLKTLRSGMTLIGMDAPAQDAQLETVNQALKAAFTAKGQGGPQVDMQALMARLETLEAVLPIEDVSFEDDFMLDLTGDEAQGFEVVAEGGSMPKAPMLDWADELRIGEWFRLEYRGRVDNVQLVWRGMRRHLNLFVTTEGRSILFQKPRLAAFLQAGLLLPANEESITVVATRSAVAKINADPQRLLN